MAAFRLIFYIVIFVSKSNLVLTEYVFYQSNCWAEEVQLGVLRVNYLLTFNLKLFIHNKFNNKQTLSLVK